MGVSLQNETYWKMRMAKLINPLFHQARVLYKSEFMRINADDVEWWGSNPLISLLAAVMSHEWCHRKAVDQNGKRNYPKGDPDHRLCVGAVHTLANCVKQVID